jgi:multidrug efflux pump subunit AcrB
MAGKYMRSLPSTVTFTVLGSLFVALTIIPFLSGLIFKRQKSSGRKSCPPVQ